MKTILTILILAGFYSCKKCADCTTTYSADGQVFSSKVMYDVCGDDLKEIDGKEAEIIYPDGSKIVEKTKCK